MDENNHPPLGTTFLTYGKYGAKFDEILVTNSLENFYKRFQTKPLWAWVHPNNEEKAQGIILELGGKLKIQSNGGASTYHFWLAAPAGENGKIRTDTDN
jgi:hypothetical protein